MAVNREEEMVALRARYANRNKKKDESPNIPNKEKVHPEEKQKIIKKKNLYIQLIKNDIGGFINMIKKIMGLKEKQKPLNLKWLESNNGRFWK